MKLFKSSPRYWPLKVPGLLILLILAAGFVIRWPGLDKQIWQDEFWSLRELHTEPNPEVLAKLGSTRWAGFTSYSVLRLCDLMIWTGHLSLVRLPLVLLGVLGCWWGWRTGRWMKQWPLGILFATLLAIWPYRAFNDNIIRFYGIQISLTVCTIMVWERFRAQPRIANFSLALVTTGLAQLTQQTAFLLILFPGFYLLWFCLRLVYCGLRSRKFPTWRAAAEPVAMALLLGMMTLVQLQLNRTPEWLLATIQNLRPDESPQVSAAAKEKAFLRNPALRETATKPAGPAIPTSDTLLQKSLEAIEQGFDWRTQRIAPLLGAPENLFWAVMPNWNSPQLQFQTPGAVANQYLWWLFAVGCLYLLFLSPPLLLSTLLGIVLTGQLVMANSYTLTGIHPRYFVGTATLMVLILAGGLATPFHPIRWLWHWRQPRTYAQAFPLLFACVPAYLFWVFWQPARQMAANHYENTRDAYLLPQKDQPKGVCYTATAAVLQNFYNDLAILREDREGKTTDWWSSPRRNIFYEVYPDIGPTFLYQIRNETFLEQLNHVQRAFNFVTLNNVSNDPVDPEWRERLDGYQPINNRDFRGYLYELGNNVYVTRGRTGLLASPRLISTKAMNATPDPNTNYELDCLFETPGPYQIRIYQPEAITLQKITFNGQPVPFAVEPAEAVNSLEPIREARKNWLTQQLTEYLPAPIEATLPETAVPHHHWVKKVENWEPIDGGTRMMNVAKFTTGAEAWKPEALRLEFAGSTKSFAPLLFFDLIQPKWEQINENYAVGDLLVASNTDKFTLSIPVRLGFATNPTFISLRVDDTSSATRLVESRMRVFNSKGRRIRIDDAFGVGPCVIPFSVAESLVNKRLNVIVQLMEGFPNPKPVTFINPSGQANAGGYLACYLMFKWEGKKLAAYVGKRPRPGNPKQ